MEKDNKVLTIAIISLLTSLGLGGSSLIDTSLDNYYICDVNNNIQEFNRLSSTSYTGYPNEFDSKDYVRCKNDTLKGNWFNLIDYAKDNNINIEDLIKINDTEDETQDIPLKPNTNTTKGIKYSCNQTECKIIED